MPLPPSPPPDKLYAVIDGTGVPMTGRETDSRDGKGEDGRACTREVKLAVFFTQDGLDKDGYPVRHRVSTSVIANFEPAIVFGDLVKAEGIRRGAGHVRQLTVIGDGSPWKLASTRPLSRASWKWPTSPSPTGSASKAWSALTPTCGWAGTDASVIALAERQGAVRIATLNRRHFAVVRPRHADALELLP